MRDDTPLVTTQALALVAVGGFAGANSRFLIGVFWTGLAGTLVANVLGSFLLGIVVYEARYTGLLSDRLHLALATGFLSSFTTYSTFVLQSVQVPPIWLVGNILGTYALGFAGVLAGREIARFIERLTTGAASGSDSE